MGRVPLLGDFVSLSLFTMLSQFNDNLDLRGFNKDTFWMDCTFPKYKSERFDENTEVIFPNLLSG